MSDKRDKMKARLPRGFADRGADDIRAVEKMMATIRSVYELYGFDPVEQPLIEYTDALGKFLPDQDRPNEGVFSFQDDDEQWLSLRYDLTAPLARYVAENFERLPKPYRSYRAGWVFRNEKPGPGRFRQFMQFDADTVGTPGVAADAEMCMMMADVMEALGIKRGDYIIRVNNRKVLDGVLEAIGLGGEDNAGRRLTVLRAIDKLDKLGADGVRLLLGAGRWDGGKEGGDFTKGAGLEAAAGRGSLHRDGETTLAEPVPAAAHATEGRLRASSRRSKRWSAAAGYGEDRIRIDPSVVRGLEYYTGPVFEAELLAEIPNEDGQIVRFGSVGGGGRYDGLVSRFRGEPVPATGFSIGVSRLMTALKNLGKLDATDVDRAGRGAGARPRRRQPRPTTSVWRRSCAPPASVPRCISAAPGMKAQMKYADRRGAPCRGDPGRRRARRGRASQIKDLVEGAQARRGDRRQSDLAGEPPGPGDGRRGRTGRGGDPHSRRPGWGQRPWGLGPRTPPIR